MKKLLLLIMIFAFATHIDAQTVDKKWGLGVGIGAYGTLNKDGVGLMPEIYFSRYLSPRLNLALKNNMGWFNSNINSNLDLVNTALNLRYKFTDESKSLRPYIYAGPSYLANNSQSAFNIDAGLGAKLFVSEVTAFYIDAGYIGGIKTADRSNTGIDNFWKATLGLEFDFGKAKDSDMDGIADKKDKCPNTPTGVMVDEYGCPLDRDGDRVADYEDDCPDEAGIISLKGCPDRDGDGIADKDDDCADVAGLKKFMGCPDTDDDGIVDKNDKCPDTPKGCAVDADGCPLDSDKDGVIDCQDKCPTEAGLKDNDGCPAVEVEWEEMTFGPVYFDFDKYNLSPNAMAKLNEVVEIVNSSASYDVIVSGYTDNIGTEEYNQKLSERRAKSIVVYLTKRGVNNAYVGIKGYGENNPIAQNTTSENRQKNRRAEFQIKIKRRK